MSIVSANKEFYQKNLSCLDEETRQKIINSPALGDLILSKTGEIILTIDNIFFHSRHNPVMEAKRLISKFQNDTEERILLFFGAGLGYAIRESIKNVQLKIFWLEANPGILKNALSLYDYSSALKNNQLKILAKPIKEDELFSSFKGLSNLPISFIPHRESFTWKEEEYIEFKYICESFFKKKDVNIATLSRFEKIWTRNILQNLPDLIRLSPVSRLFNISQDIPIIVSGAGPSLYNDLEKLKIYRDEFILIAVDTALHIFANYGIEPDLIYSVDPQALNSSYLEGYNGEARIVFDPTSSYHTLRLSEKIKNGFFTSSPFPLTKIISEISSESIGDVPFGGSVSTNAISLAELMKGSPIFFIGQDLAFTDGYAHCKGAILEERLNFKESRFFKREMHNHKQINALVKKKVTGSDGKSHITNEKMLIFKKWFEDASKNKNWINLTSSGSKLEGIQNGKFEEYFQLGKNSEKIKLIRKSIKDISGKGSESMNRADLKIKLLSIVENLALYEKLLVRGISLSKNIYKSVQNEEKDHSKIQDALKEMNEIDELVSSKKNLSEIIGTAVQRVVLMITEDYDVKLNLHEKKNPRLQIAKKSLLLYEGLLDACKLTEIQMKKVLFRIDH